MTREEDIQQEGRDARRTSAGGRKRRHSDSDEPGEDPPEPQDPNMQPLPEENEKNTHRRTRSTFSTSVMKGQVSIRLFMVRHNNAETEGLRHFLS
jgi:hypothetical protein